MPSKVSKHVDKVAMLVADDLSETIAATLAAGGIGWRAIGPDRASAAIEALDAGAALIDEALVDEPLLKAIAEALSTRPAELDFPFLLIALEGSKRTEAIAEALGNVRIIERPVVPELLRASLRSALRSRARRSGAGDCSDEAAEARLQKLGEELEATKRRLMEEARERRRAERRLGESEELYRHTVEISQQLVWTASPRGRILSLSERFRQLTGLDPEADPNAAWLNVVHPEDRDCVLAAWSETIRAGQAAATEFRMRVAGGRYRTFIARVAPRKDERGKVTRWYGFTEDIEEQKRAQAARVDAEERYRLAAKATNDAIWDLDLNTHEVHWSESAAEALGYAGRKLGATSLAWWEDRVHPEDRRKATETLDMAIKRGSGRWSATYRFRKANGDYATFFDRGFIVRDEQGAPSRFVGAMTDLTERQRAEEEIRRMQAELIHVSRLSAMGTMGSTLAHELNQPLTAVTNYIRGSRRLLAEGGKERIAEVEEALGAAEAGALRAGQIVRRLRELVARGTAAIRREELPKLIADAEVIAFLDADALGVEHRLELDPAAQWVEADRIQIQQVLINLIRNAMQATRDSERPEVIVCTRKTSRKQIEVSVADNGDGISPEFREALFSPFQGTKAEGLGIGLSISRTIVEAHGGKIWAEDRAGGGSVFRFTLPALGDPRPTAAA